MVTIRQKIRPSFGRPANLFMLHTHNAANLSPQAKRFSMRFVCFIVIMSGAKITVQLFSTKKTANKFDFACKNDFISYNYEKTYPFEHFAYTCLYACAKQVRHCD
jgi:hypothetical protein